ncbi:3-hydroxyacyl-CoA dehydrogenase NAD-binding domain-containing protein [Elioraea rosea]|uniref:3-hydroxyacyl-CoA dehydrogenase NAD-binding domain-containing protein n=1 Tax=Elioraea rosea TaxID=2492390 RepID=UPI001183C4C5|nr:3-hydroxyacyl-CoA dehydrogenase NAD-binding domain-containing protein [Elioraea rosea]
MEQPRGEAAAPGITVAVIGTGLIGVGWAALMLARGLSVSAWDPSPGFAERLASQVEARRAALAPLGLVPNLSRLTAAATLEEAVYGAGFVQENAPDTDAAKRPLLATLDAATAQGVPIASSTSALLLSPLVADLPGAERFLLGHPINPADLMPLVEISGGERTSRATIDRAVAFYRSLGKRPVVLNREVAGHIAGRLAAALYREAVALVEDGIADAATVDEALSASMGLRWAATGVHLSYHLGGGPGGLAHYLDHLGPAQERRWASMRTPALTPDLKARLVSEVEAIAAGRSVAELEAERDARLAALLRALGAAEARHG